MLVLFLFTVLFLVHYFYFMYHVYRVLNFMHHALLCSVSDHLGPSATVLQVPVVLLRWLVDLLIDFAAL